MGEELAVGLGRQFALFASIRCWNSKGHKAWKIPCALWTLLKAPGSGIGEVPISGKGEELTYSAGNFKKAILLNIPLLNSSILRRSPEREDITDLSFWG